MLSLQRIIVIAICFKMLLCLDVAAQRPSIQRGIVTLQQMEAGKFHEYIPKARVTGTNVLVLCHGSIEADGPDAQQVSRTFIDRWLPFSEKHGFVLVAPVFDEANYGSGKNAPGGEAWGYRALDGRTTTPDQFVHQIVDRFKTIDSKYDGRFFLYGHSAGAQFANHYLVVHPHRLRGVILSAPAIYAMPDPESPWPTGMKERKRKLQWGIISKEFEISHQLETWVAAVQVPTAVVIGSADTERLSDQPQQGGWTRVERSEHYAKEMKQFALENKVVCGVYHVSVPKVGHSSEKLTPAAAQALVTMWQKKKR